MANCNGNIMTMVNQQQTEIIKLLEKAVELIGKMTIGNCGERNAADQVYSRGEARPACVVVKTWNIVYGGESNSKIPENLRMEESLFGAMGGIVDTKGCMRLVKQGGLSYFSFYNFYRNIKSNDMMGGYLDRYDGIDTIAVKPSFKSNRDFTFTFENGETITFNQLDTNRYGSELEKKHEWTFKYPSNENDGVFPTNLQMTGEQLEKANRYISRSGTMMLIRNNDLYFVIYNDINGSVKSTNIDLADINIYMEGGELRVKIDATSSSHFKFTLENQFVICFEEYSNIFRRQSGK